MVNAKRIPIPGFLAAFAGQTQEIIGVLRKTGESSAISQTEKLHQKPTNGKVWQFLLGRLEVLLRDKGQPDSIQAALHTGARDVVALEIVFAGTALWAAQANAREHFFVGRAIAGYVAENPATFATKALQALASRR